MTFSQSVCDFLTTQSDRKCLPKANNPIDIVMAMGQYQEILDKLDDLFENTDVVPLFDIRSHQHEIPDSPSSRFDTQSKHILTYPIPVNNGFTTAAMHIDNYGRVLVGYRPYFILSNPCAYLQASQASSVTSCAAYFHQIIDDLYRSTLTQKWGEDFDEAKFRFFNRLDMKSGSIHASDVEHHYLPELESLLTRRDSNSGLWPMPYLDGFYLEIDVWHIHPVNGFNCSGYSSSTTHVKMLDNGQVYPLHSEKDSDETVIFVRDNDYHFVNGGFTAY